MWRRQWPYHHGDAASKLARVASAARALVPESFEVASCQDKQWQRIWLPEHRFCGIRTVQLNACKLAQVLKGLHTGVLRKPRRLRAAAVTFDKRAIILTTAHIAL